MSTTTSPSSAVQILFTQDDRKRLKMEAMQQGVTMSELIRMKMGIADGKIDAAVAIPVPLVEDEIPDADSELSGVDDVPMASRKDELFTTRMPQILDALSDANYQPSEVLKLIAMESAAVVNAMSNQSLGWGFGGQGKRLEVKLKALTQLGKLVESAEELSKKDILNLDGPKFEHCWGKFIDWMNGSMMEAGLNEEMSKSVLVIFRDKASNGQEELQKELDTIDSN